jgi:hypothetical protein
MRRWFVCLGLASMAATVRAEVVHSVLKPACTQGTIAIGQTIENAWDAQDCVDNLGRVVDFWNFSASAGAQLTVTVTFSDASLAPVILGLQRESDGLVLASNASSSPVILTYTIPETDDYYLAVNSSHASAFGSYTLSLAGTGTCTTSDTVLCLLSGRYSVTADWQKSTGEAGQGHAFTLTGDTGYFWFFDSSNVETVVKVLDGCALGGHRWVFASGLTNVQVTIHVTDSLNPGTVKTYVNPQGVAFQPIQDTSALPCS